MNIIINDETFINHIKNIIYNEIFIKLIEEEKIYLLEYTINILEIIYIKFHIDYDIFKYQMMLNNSRDIKSLILLLLPYVDNKEDYINFKKLNTLNDIITLKKNSENYNNSNQDKNLYKLSTFQISIGEDNDDKFKEINYNDNDILKANYSLLLSTIEQISYKLYANWINIYPISYYKYTESKLYKNTFKYNYTTQEFECSIKDVDLDWWNTLTYNNIMNKYSGITINDVYNVFINYYYLSIKDIEFLIYEKYNKDNFLREPYIKLIDDKFNNKLINKFIKKENWDYLREDEKNFFKAKYEELLNSKDNNEMIININKAFEKYYEHLSDIKNYIRTSNIDIIKKNLIDNDNFKYLYEYLLLSVNKLKNTPYYFYLFDEEEKLKPNESSNDDKFPLFQKIKNKDDIKADNNFVDLITGEIFGKNKLTFGINNNNVIFDGNIIPITNIDNNCLVISCYDYYNFAKLLFKEFKESVKWDNLNINKRDKVIEYFNNNNNKKYKNKFIDSAYSSIANDTIRNEFVEEYKNIIHHYIRTKCFDITFKTLARFGLLTEFKYNPELTDNINHITGNDLNEQTKLLKKKLKNQIDKYNFEQQDINNSSNNNYTSFKELYKDNYYYVNNQKYSSLKVEKYKDIDYFDILNEDSIKWFTTHTFNWIMQIDFYHKFINKRVILVTGGTGQGKSTFFPMLIYYGIKTFDYNLKGKIIITQPRITPVEKNSEYIAEQLLVPIKDKHKNLIDNDLVDTTNGFVQFTHSKHEHITKTNEHFLRLTTDGKLLAELTDNFLLKKKIISNKKINEFKFLDENIFDIIGIDESHEHNANMDIILSIMRYSLLYNTSLRLFIISATLDEDECSYRRFFKCIDDNLKYPINVFNIKTLNNRLLIDGRIHISPPGTITRFEIKEYYEKNEPNNTKDATIIGINKTLEIINTTNNGEILFFTYSIKECIKICNELNKKTSNQIVAIPFFAKMNNKYKNYIENLDKYKNKININKDNIVDIYANIIEESSIITTNYIYNRIIIVATNAAEASITIHNLKFVVDIGYQINVIYNPVNDSSEVKIEKITESSRIQRKGRVGRSESGNVYYIYEKGSREDIKSEYDICNSNLIDTIYNILYDNYKELPLFYNINFYKDYNYLKNEDNLKKTLKTYTYLPEFEIFKKQFIIDDKLFQMELPLYELNLMIFKKLKKEYNKINIYNSGFDITNVKDNYGNFYIIHPDENKIKRDIRTGRILENNNIQLVQINKVNIYIKYLTFKNLIVDLNLDLDLSNQTESNEKIAKTKINILIKNILKYFRNLEYNIDYAVILIYSILYNCSEDIIRILSVLISYSNLSSLYEKNGKKVNLNFQKLYKNNKGDIFVFLDIFINFFNTFYFTNNSVDKGNSYEYNYEKFKNILNESQEKKTKFDINIFNKFIKYQRELSINTEETKKLIDITKKDSDFKDILDSNRFDKWCKYYFLNKDTMNKIITNYFELKENYISLETAEKNKDYNFFSKLEQLLYINKSSNKIDNIIKCIIWGYRQNLVEYKGYHYYNILKQNNYINTEVIPNIPETTIVHTQYLLYINNNNINNNNNISLLINIEGFNIYNLKFYFKKNSNFINNYDIIFLNNNLSFIKNTQNDLIRDLSEKDKTIIHLLKEIILLDKKNNIDSIENSILDKDAYKKRYKLLNIIDFYYYFMKELVK